MEGRAGGVSEGWGEPQLDRSAARPYPDTKAPFQGCFFFKKGAFALLEKASLWSKDKCAGGLEMFKGMDYDNGYLFVYKTKSAS